MAYKLMVVSGFLGSGKTTSITAIGKMLIEQGKKVGVVTNDQGANLADTNYIKDEGMSVFEITEGCFCCSFDSFTKKLQNLATNQMPDIILAEPVGSCINLIGTIFKPILNNYTKDFTLLPLSVVADPKRVKRMMRDNASFKNEINYMFDCQLSEADVILLNKTDKLSKEEIEELTNYLRIKYAPAQVLPISAETGEGISLWLDIVSNKTAIDKEPLSIDYSIYQKAENSLAWNSTFTTIEAQNKIDFNEVLEKILDAIRKKIGTYEIAHLKAYAVSSYDFAKVGITSTDGDINFNRKLEQTTNKVNLIINGRVECEPNFLEEAVIEGIKNVCKELNILANDMKAESYAPDYKVPACRF